MSDRDPKPRAWSGVTVFDCPFCAYDSEQRAKVVAHIADAHPLPEELPPAEPKKKAKAKE